MGQVDRADAAAVHLVGVGRADAALGRADLFGAGARLVERVGALVVFEDQLGAVAQLDLFGVEALFGDGLHLLHQADRIDHYAVADHALHARAEDAGRNQMQHIAVLADLDGVTGVIAALKADDHVDVAGQHVDQFSFAFVSPLSSDQNINRHISFPCCYKVLLIKTSPIK